MTTTLDISDELNRRAAEMAAAENVTMEDWLAAALDAWVFEFERLKKRAAQGSHEKFLQAMAKVPDVDPPEYDRL